MSHSAFWSSSKEGVVYPPIRERTRESSVARPMRTRVSEMLDIAYPLVMGGMTGVGTPDLAAAFSRAGGLGTFAIHNAKPAFKGDNEAEHLASCRQWIRQCREQCGGKNFGVNLTILPAAVPPPYEKYAELIIEEGVAVMETAGSGGPLLWGIIARAKAAGITCIHKCTSVRHAVSAAKRGVDIISVDGFECAGHPGRDDVGGLVLLASASAQLNIPFIASGGVANGAQLAAVLALGAEGANLGTRVCVTQEANWHANYKQRALESTELDTVIVCRKLGDPTRFYRNTALKEAAAIEEAAAPGDFKIEDIFHIIAGKRGREAEARGDPDMGQWSAGQSVGLINDVPTVEELIQNLIHDAYDTMGSRLAPLLGAQGAKL